VNVVVDSSAWIDFLAGKRPTTWQVATLETALAEGRVIVPPIVIAELLSGARTAAEHA
jgi:predicted nucleic acid-binding protein